MKIKAQGIIEVNKYGEISVGDVNVTEALVKKLDIIEEDGYAKKFAGKVMIEIQIEKDGVDFSDD